MRVCMHVYIHICIFSCFFYICMHIYIYIYIYRDIYMYVSTICTCLLHFYQSPPPLEWKGGGKVPSVKGRARVGKPMISFRREMVSGRGGAAGRFQSSHPRW